MTGGLELSAPSPDLQGGERGWRLNQSPKAHELINDGNDSYMIEFREPPAC